MNKIKKIVNNKYFIIGLITLFIVIIGITGTYAWLTWSSPNTTKMTMTIGNIADVMFDNGQDINTTDLSPVFYPEEGEKNNFSILKRSTAASTNITYTITLDIITIANELKSTSFKYKLINTTSDSEVVSGNFSSASNGSTLTLYTGTLTDTRVDYTFLIYIDSNIESNTNMMNKQFIATLNVSASEKQNINLAQYITNLYTNASKSPITNNSITYNTAPSVGLMNDRLGSSSTDINGGNIRYYGASPDNYIYFNCSDYNNQSDSTCEKWRIIGVFDGKVKIMRGSTIGSYSWDNKNTSTGAESASGKNDWTDARLMKLLNPGYESETTGGSLYYNSGSGSCYSGQNNATKTCNFTSTGIKNDITRNLISDTLYYLGGWDSISVYSEQIYGYERGTNVYSGRPTTWTGKIALPYPSDYGYAADLGSCTVALESYNNSACTSVNWMKQIFGTSSFGWLLTPYSGYSYYAWYVPSSGDLSTDNFTYYANGVAPVLYLGSELGIESGEGTSLYPYRLSV